MEGGGGKVAPSERPVTAVGRTFTRGGGGQGEAANGLLLLPPAPLLPPLLVSLEEKEAAARGALWKAGRRREGLKADSTHRAAVENAS